MSDLGQERVNDRDTRHRHAQWRWLVLRTYTLDYGFSRSMDRWISTALVERIACGRLLNSTTTCDGRMMRSISKKRAERCVRIEARTQLRARSIHAHIVRRGRREVEQQKAAVQT